MSLWVNVRQSVSFASTWLNQSGSLYVIFRQSGSVGLNVPPRASRTRLGGPGRSAPSAFTVECVLTKPPGASPSLPKPPEASWSLPPRRLLLLLNSFQWSFLELPIPEPPRASWRLLKPPRASRSLPEPPGASRSLPERPRPEPPGASQTFLEPPRPSWRLLEPPRPSQSLPRPPGASWSLP